ncbi:MAG: hypothetical protein ACOX18_10690 [Bacillota bacterium]|jgi:hypothetical protein
MKQHLSVLTLAARSTIYKVLGLLIAMAVVQGILFYLTLETSLANEPPGLEQVISQSRIALVCGAGFLLLCLLLSLTGYEIGGSKLRYTLQRLSIEEKTTVFWWAGYNAVCFFLFWAAQLVIALLLCRLYLTKVDAAYTSGQTILLAFYRNSWLHSLLPLADVSRYLRNAVFALCLGLSAACFSFRQRHDKIGIAVVVVAGLVAVSFALPMGDVLGDVMLSLTALVIAGGAMINVWRERGREHEVEP